MIRARDASPRTLRLRGMATVAVVGALIAVIAANPFSRRDVDVAFDIVAPTLPDGVRTGLPVDIRGETVGEVCGLDISQPVSTRVRLCVRKPAMGEMTDDVAVSFVSRNLFGSDALRLTPADTGARLIPGGTLMLTQAPADYTITATVRSAGGFTLPVLTPRLSELLGEVSEATIRMSPFLTAATVALQTMDQSRVTDLTVLMPTISDALSGMGMAGDGAIQAMNTIIGNRLLDDKAYTDRVSTMIADIGGLFGDIGGLSYASASTGSNLDLIIAMTTPLRAAMRGVTPQQVGELIERTGGAFHRDPGTGRMVLDVEADLTLVPAVATVLGQLFGGKGGRP